MTLREEIDFMLESINKEYPAEPIAVQEELNKRGAMLSRATVLKTQAKTILTKARKKATKESFHPDLSATAFKDIVAGLTVQEQEAFDLADGLHSDLVHTIGIGRTILSSERENLRTMPTARMGRDDMSLHVPVNRGPDDD